MKDCRGQNVIDFSPATRKSHPDTSREAEKKITESGERAKQCGVILSCLRQNNGSNQYDLAEKLQGILTRDQIWRRRADLIHNGYIKIEGKKNRCGIWWIR